MTQSTILAAGQTAATSTDVTVASGVEVIVGMFCADMTTPTNAAFATASTGGTLVPATYYYRVSAINALGETLASTETSQVVGAGTNTNTVTVNWAAITGATGYKVYGRSTGAELLIATVGAVTTYIDTGAVTPAGALPAANTTAGGIPPNTYLTVYQATPGKDRIVGTITPKSPSIPLKGPATFRIARPALNCGLNIGISLDVA